MYQKFYQKIQIFYLFFIIKYKFIIIFISFNYQIMKIHIFILYYSLIIDLNKKYQFLNQKFLGGKFYQFQLFIKNYHQF